MSLPSLRINEQLRQVGDLMNTDRHSGLTLAPEAARDDMRRQIGKPITNDDLYAGCRRAFENGFSRVKLYFMCGLPGERETDLEGIIEMSETISRLGQEVTGRQAAVVANVSNFVPKPQTPYQWNAMQRREYFSWAHEFLHRRKRLRSVQLKCHDVETSLLEGVMCRGDRRRGRGDRVGVAARRPVRRLGGKVAAAVVVASDFRRRHRRGKNASPPLPCPVGVAVGSYLHSAGAGVLGARAAAGGGAVGSG